MPSTPARDGAQIGFDQAGAGPPLVLIHGITESSHTWDPLIPALAQAHTVLTVDLPGHGESGPAASYDIRALAEAVADVVEAAGLQSPVVVGHSLGAMVATAYGAAHPVRAIMNVDQPLQLAELQGALSQLEPMLRGDQATFAAAIGAVFDAMYGQLSDAERQRVAGLRQLDQDVVLGIWAPLLDAPPAALDELVRSMGSAVDVPYLSLHGIDPGHGYPGWLAKVIPGATVEVWPGLGHYPHLAEPERFLDRLADFEHSSARGPVR